MYISVLPFPVAVLPGPHANSKQGAASQAPKPHRPAGIQASRPVTSVPQWPWSLSPGSHVTPQLGLPLCSSSRGPRLLCGAHWWQRVPRGAASEGGDSHAHHSIAPAHRMRPFAHQAACPQAHSVAAPPPRHVRQPPFRSAPRSKFRAERDLPFLM